MKSRILFLLFCCFGPTVLFSQNIPALSIQGVLKKIDGSAVPDDVYNVRFSLYTAEVGGTEVWFEELNDVETTGGVYSVVLGIRSGFPLNAPFDVPYYLGVKFVGSGQELLPRPRLTAAPYAVSMTGATNKVPSSGAARLDRLFLNLGPNGGNGVTLQWGSGGEVVQATSSARYKENITSLEENFEVLLQAEPKKYTRKGGNPTAWEVGFIAEEFEALGLTPLVFYDEQGRPNGLYYEKMVTYIVPILRDKSEQIKTQADRIKALEAENAEMKKMYMSLRADVDALKGLK
ncbi:MAG: tail fiber domain-containing protein [Lewinellaceae bacterium]|nr:tail fiber domain-containing protein [Lewinellaceae bacterium]